MKRAALKHTIVYAQRVGSRWFVVCKCGWEGEMASLHPRWRAVAEALIGSASRGSGPAIHAPIHLEPGA